MQLLPMAAAYSEDDLRHRLGSICFVSGPAKYQILSFTLNIQFFMKKGKLII